MNVVHVTLRFDAPGGVETTVREVTRRLAAQGVHVRVFASDLYDEAARERRSEWAARVDGVPVERFPVRFRLVPGLTLPAMVGLVDALAASGADVIHAHSHRYGHVLESAAVADRRGIPLVVSTHYHPADRDEPPLKKGLLRLQDFGFGMTAYRTARAVVVETEREAALVREFAPADRVRVIPPGIDLTEWAASADAPRPTLVPVGPYLLFVGRIAPNKGLPFLVEAYAAVPAPQRPPLVMMGRDWGERARVEALAARLGVGDQVRWLGHVPDRATYRAIVRSAAALVLPSEWEAFGLVAVDAMAAGTPVVATSVGGLPEVLEGGRAGRLVEYGDRPALTAALVEVGADRSGTERRVARAREIAAGLDWSVAVRRHLELYRSLGAV